MPKNQLSNAAERAKINHVNVFCAYDEIVQIEELKPNPKNPNTHPDEQIKMLADIIAQTGWRAPITVSTRSGFIVKGHGRLKAAQLAGCESAPEQRAKGASDELDPCPFNARSKQSSCRIPKF